MKKTKKPKVESFMSLSNANLLNGKKLLIFVAGFAVIGAVLILATRAATPTTSLDPEARTVISPAITGSDSNASGGGYVQFKAASTTTPGNRAKATLGVFPGYGDAYGTASFMNFESFLGRQLSFADVNMGAQSWADFSGTTWGQFTVAYGTSDPHGQGMFYTLSRVTPAITVGLNVRPNSGYTPSNPSAMYAATAARFQEVISGVDDGYYRDLAQKLVATGHGNAILRLGHEPDLDFYPWSMTGGNQNLYKQAFQHVHDVMKAVSASFKFDYQGDGSWDFGNPYDNNVKFAESGYPGDAYVDYIGCDIYDAGGRWPAAKAKMDYTQNLAKLHGKQMSIPEWGLWANYNGSNGGDDNPSFIQNMYDWINAAPASGPGSVAYHVYFNNGADSGIQPHNLDRYPNAKAKFKQLFGN